MVHVRLKTYELELLCSVLAEIEMFIEINERLQRSDQPFIRSMREKGVPFTPVQWKGDSITAAQKMAYSRAVRRLEQANLLTRLKEVKRDRTTHVRPTETAIALMVGELGERLSQRGVRESLKQTEWGRSLAESSSLKEGIEHVIYQPDADRNVDARSSQALRKEPSRQ